MGNTKKAKCLDCENEFEFDTGGGFSFHLLRCDVCGIKKVIRYDDIYDLRNRYIKGLPESYFNLWGQDEFVHSNTNIKPISEKDYDIAVEKYAGACKCGGSFLFNASPRCSVCHSTNIEKGEIIVFYD